MFRILWLILKDEYGATLAITRKTANSLITSTGFNTNYDEIEAVVNALTSANYAADSVGKAALNSDVVRSNYGLVQHTDGALYVDVSDTNPSLELTDGGLRAKVDGTTIERTASGLAVLVGTTANKILQLDSDAKIPAVDGSQLTGVVPADSIVSQSKLKTSTGEVSTTNTADTKLTLPGGEYGFYPQIKASTAEGNEYTASIFEKATLVVSSTSYETVISMATATGGGRTMYAQQRYVTASGLDFWIFLLLHKIKKNIIAGFAAPDHPAYGNGGDFNKYSHPFRSWNKKTEQIVLVNKSMTMRLLREAKQRNKSPLTLIHEEYRVNPKKEKYEPLHSGKFIDEEPVLVKTIPDFITVHKLVKQ